MRGFDDTVQKVTINRIIDGIKDLPPEHAADVVAAADEVAAGAEGYMADERPELARAGVEVELQLKERKEKLNRAVSYLLQSFSIGRTHLENSAKLVKDAGIVGGAMGVAGAGVTDGFLWMTGKLVIVLPWLIGLF